MFEVGFKGKGVALSKQAKLSKQVIEIWTSTFSPDLHFIRTLTIAFGVAAVHSIPFFIPRSWLPASRESTPKPNTVQVRIMQAPPRIPTTEAEKPVELAKIEVKKPKKTPPPQQKVLTSSEKNTEATTQTVVSAPDLSPNPAPPPPSAQSQRKGALMEDKVSPLLPSGKDDFIAHQRKLGEIIGAGPIAGDLEIPDVMTEKDSKEPITRTEYTFAGYFDNLSRRFTETWGGMRTLPAYSRFEGKVGEFIEYDVVINRDGSLRKIVNISAKREPFRDFAAVDELVVGVFKTMFPFQPVPQRIRNDPLVIRKRIQFVGFKYTLY